MFYNACNKLLAKSFQAAGKCYEFKSLSESRREEKKGRKAVRGKGLVAGGYFG